MFNRIHQILLATSALVPLSLLPALANPLGGTVVGGTAVIQGQGTPNVIVNQSTDRAIINWNTFNIGVNERTQFIQPNSMSVALNRVTGGLGPSQILGMLTGNGWIFVVNPDGILFGPNSKVDAAGFLATTNDIANTDFMAGRYNFSIPGRPTASIVNQGTITAQDGGFAALVAPGVRNTGIITARLGKVSLASANSFSLDFYGDNLITLGVNDSIAATVIDVATGEPLSSLVSNEGKLKANGGTVELTAVAARQIVDSVINNTGLIEANTIGTHDGKIILEGPTATTKPAGLPVQKVKISGTISAAGKQKNTKGGTVVITGENIELANAYVDASGLLGGGVVLIGGDTSGGKINPAAVSIAKAALESYAVATATTVTVDANTKIDVSAKDAGDGGKVIVWADQSTRFSGAIFAGAGLLTGDGGFVEVSGHDQLAFDGTVDTSAPHGNNGTLLLDPQNVTIGTIGTWIVTPIAIENALASGNVIVSTNGAGTDLGDITVAQSVTWANANTLTLSANRNITINDGVTISNTNAGSLNLRADNQGTGIGTINFLGTGKIDFSQSTGLVFLFYNPPDNPAGSVVNPTSYTVPTDYSPYVLTNGSVPNQLTAYMLVNTVYDLQNIQNNLSGTYALGKDIDASATASWNSGAGFIPIGNAINQFKGALNGNHFAVNYLSISASGGFGPAGTLFVGLFGYIGAAGKVFDMNLNNISIEANAGPAAGYVGWVAGINEGTISGVNVTGTASISGNGGVVFGGIAGTNFGLIYRSSATGSMVDQYGGLAGGIVGDNAGTIRQSYANVNLSYPDSGTGAYAVVGGFVGVNEGSIDQSYSIGTVAGGNHTAGDFVGDNRGTITESYAAASFTGTSLPVGFDPTVWGINATINNGYPYLLWQVAAPAPPPTVLTGGPPPSPPPPIPYQPLLPPGFTDVFGTGQTNSFNFSGYGDSTAPTTTATKRNAGIPLLAPVDWLTVPAIEGIVTAGLAPLTRLLPADLANQFQADVTKKITDILGDSTLSISSASLNVVALAIGDIASIYIDKATNRIASCSGTGCGPVEAGAAQYVMQVAVNTAIDYITTPPLWATGPAGVAAAVDAAIVQSTVTNVVGLTMLLLNW